MIRTQSIQQNIGCLRRWCTLQYCRCLHRIHFTTKNALRIVAHPATEIKLNIHERMLNLIIFLMRSKKNTFKVAADVRYARLMHFKILRHVVYRTGSVSRHNWLERTPHNAMFQSRFFRSRPWKFQRCGKL